MTEHLTRRSTLLWTITAIYWLALFVATHLPPARVPRLGVSDKISHFAGYAVLAALLLLSLRAKEISLRASAWWAVAICLIYAAIDEYLQIFVGRHSSFDDWFADAAGAVTVASLVIVVGAMREVRQA